MATTTIRDLGFVEVVGTEPLSISEWAERYMAEYRERFGSDPAVNTLRVAVLAEELNRKRPRDEHEPLASPRDQLHQYVEKLRERVDGLEAEKAQRERARSHLTLIQGGGEDA